MQSIERKIVSRIFGTGRGWAFSQSDFADLGGRAAIATFAADRPGVPEEVIRLHGHDCPGVTMGYRMASEAMKAMPADSKLIAITEHRFCGVDALQWVTGCTAGKSNLKFKDYGKLAFTLYDADTKKGVRVLVNIDRVPADVRKDREAFIKWLVAADAAAFLTIKPVDVNEPEVSRTKESAPCAACGESVTLTHLREYGGKKLCIPCARKRVDRSN